MAALGAALSAALLEKLLVDARHAPSLRRIRRECVALIERDAKTFARVIGASRSGRRGAFVRALQQAIDIPCRVFEHAARLQLACRKAQRSVPPAFQSDLRCAVALALAAGESARTLVATNLNWLGDPAYARRIRHRLQMASRTNGSSRGR